MDFSQIKFTDFLLTKLQFCRKLHLICMKPSVSYPQLVRLYQRSVIAVGNKQLDSILQNLTEPIEIYRIL